MSGANVERWLTQVLEHLEKDRQAQPSARHPEADSHTCFPADLY